MKKIDEKLIKNLLGEDIFEELEKSSIIKLNTNTGLDPEEVKVALQIVPRSILSFLISNLRDKKSGEIIELPLPFCDGCMNVNKKGPNNYNGDIVQNGKIVLEFMNRSLSSLGLLVLTTFELYDDCMIDDIRGGVTKESHKESKLQEIRDNRLMMNNLISSVVDQKIQQKEAINRIIHEKLIQHLSEKKEEQPMEEHSKKSKLKQFLEQRESRRTESLELDKSEIKCPDCTGVLYKGEKHIDLCICYGEHYDSKIKIVKSKEGGVKLKFPKKFEVENIEMLLDVLKNK